MNGKSVLGSNCRSAVPTLTLTLLKHKSIILSIHIICIILQKMHNGTKDREPSPDCHVDRNKKRIDRWSKFTRLQLPVNNVSVNSNTTVPQNGTSVNTHSMQNSSEDAQDGEVRKSVKDSQGNTLSEAQQVFFKNSVVRDGDGNLLVVYHGTDAEFTEKTEGRFSVLLDNQDNRGDHHRTVP